MDEILNTLPVIWKLILGFCGMVVAVGGAAAILARLSAPVKELKNHVAELKRHMEDLERIHKNDQQGNLNRFDKDLKEIKLLEEANRHLCQCMVALMDHEITGNSIERLKNAKDELNRFLIEK